MTTTASVRFIVPGPPQGKGRARIVKIGGFSRMATPPKTVAYEGLIALAAAQAMADRPPIAGPIACHVEAVFAVPASWPKAKRAAALAGQIRPTCKPDYDNTLKAVGDAGNGVLWPDDAAIVCGSLTKLYGPTPELRVIVAPLDINPPATP